MSHCSSHTTLYFGRELERKAVNKIQSRKLKGYAAGEAYKAIFCDLILAINERIINSYGFFCRRDPI